MDKKCSKCGNPLSDSSAFCPACGTAVHADEPARSALMLSVLRVMAVGASGVVLPSSPLSFWQLQSADRASTEAKAAKYTKPFFIISDVPLRSE